MERIEAAASAAAGSEKATLRRVEHVRETHDGRLVWDGEVHAFQLTDHPYAQHCYAWEYDADDGKKRIATVLGVPPINSTRDAVRAFIAAGYDEGPPRRD